MRSESKSLCLFLAIILFAATHFAVLPSLAADVTPPKVYAGVEVYYKNVPFELTGGATDLESKYLDMEWSQQSGPSGGKIIFSKPKCLKQNFNAYCTTTISANKDGVYVFRLTSTNDTKLSAYDDSALVWDTVAPILTETVPVPAITNSSRPSYTFRSSPINAESTAYNQYGDIDYSGACNSGRRSAKGGDNIIAFYPLRDGTYNNCTITVTDIAGNKSNVLKVSPFKVDTSVPVTPPTTERPACTSWTYTDWSPCDKGEQVRTTTASFPENCVMTGAKPVTKQNCTAETGSGRPVCTSWDYTDWSPCDKGEQVRTTTVSYPENCIMSEIRPVTKQNCTAETNERPVCTSFTYGDWSPCDKGKQFRVWIEALPTDCIMSGVKPFTKQSCVEGEDEAASAPITACDRGLMWNSKMNKCTNSVLFCRDTFAKRSVYNKTAKECECRKGFKLDGTKKTCVKMKASVNSEK